MFLWVTNEDGDVAKSLAGLVKYNGGRFKSEKQRDFLKGKREVDGSLFGLSGEEREFFLIVKGKVNNGINKPTYYIDFIYKANAFGILAKYKLTYPKGKLVNKETVIEIDPESLNPNGIEELI